MKTLSVWFSLVGLVWVVRFGWVTQTQSPSILNILSIASYLKLSQKWLSNLGAVPLGEVLEEGDLRGGVKLNRISSNNIWRKFCLLK